MATKKKTTKKPAAKKTAKKKAAKKAPAKKAKAKAAPKPKPATGSKAAAKPKAAAPEKKAAPAKKPGKGEFTAESVNLGHLFALRPRVNTSFPPAEFLKAKRALADERYGSLDEAARAVAERALEDSNKKPGKHKVGHRR